MKQLYRIAFILCCLLFQMACTSQQASTKTRENNIPQSTNVPDNKSATLTVLSSKTIEITTQVVSPTKVVEATATVLPAKVPESTIEFQVLANRLTHQPGATWPEIQHLVVLEINPADHSTEVKHILDEAMGGGSYSFENRYYAWTPERNVSRLEPDGQIWEIELPSEKRRVLASAPEEGGRVEAYEWSPKEGKLAFSTEYTTTENVKAYSLWVQNEQGQLNKLLNEDLPIVFTWAPNSEHLLVYNTKLDDNNEVIERTISTLNANIGEQKVLVEYSEGSGGEPNFGLSFDEKLFVTFQSDSIEGDNGYESIYDVWVYDIEAQETNLILKDSKYGYPHWMPSGNLLVFHPISRVGFVPYEINPDGSHLKPLGRETGDIELDFKWSPDGQELLYTSSGVDFYSHHLYLWDTQQPFSESIKLSLPEDFAIELIDW